MSGDEFFAGKYIKTTITFEKEFMEIINVTTTKTAQERNEHGLYLIDYTITNGCLERVHAAVYDSSANLSGEMSPPFFGNVTYENGQIFCSLSEGAPVAILVSDFELYLKEIKAKTDSESQIA